MRNFTMTADTPAQAQATPCLQKALVETKLVSWIENYMWHLPKRRHILKYVAHEHLGVLGFFLLLHKSHTTFFPPDFGQEKKLQNSNWHTIVPDIQEKFALTAGWWGGSLQTFLSYLNIFCRMSEKSLHREVAGLTKRAGTDTLLELQDLNSLWLISRGKLSNMFRHNCLLLLQDLTAPCCSIFGLFSRAANAPHGHCLYVRISVLWQNPEFPDRSESDLLLYLQHDPESEKLYPSLTKKKKKARMCTIHVPHFLKKVVLNN